MGFGFILWLVPNFYAGVVAVAMRGFFLGPFFPAAVVVATKLLPRAQHVSAIGFAAALGGTAQLSFRLPLGQLRTRTACRCCSPLLLGCPGRYSCCGVVYRVCRRYGLVRSRRWIRCLSRAILEWTSWYTGRIGRKGGRIIARHLILQRRKSGSCSRRNIPFRVPGIRFFPATGLIDISHERSYHQAVRLLPHSA